MGGTSERPRLLAGTFEYGFLPSSNFEKLLHGLLSKLLEIGQTPLNPKTRKIQIYGGLTVFILQMQDASNKRSRGRESDGRLPTVLSRATYRRTKLPRFVHPGHRRRSFGETAPAFLSSPVNRHGHSSSARRSSWFRRASECGVPESYFFWSCEGTHIPGLVPRAQKTS